MSAPTGRAPAPDAGQATIARVAEREQPIQLGLPCPGCGEPWLRSTQLAGRFRCVYCLQRYELASHCANCGEHQTIARMSSTVTLRCQSCGHSMLNPL